MLVPKTNFLKFKKNFEKRHTGSSICSRFCNVLRRSTRKHSIFKYFQQENGAKTPSAPPSEYAVRPPKFFSKLLSSLLSSKVHEHLSSLNLKAMEYATLIICDHINILQFSIFFCFISYSFKILNTRSAMTEVFLKKRPKPKP